MGFAAQCQLFVQSCKGASGVVLYVHVGRDWYVCWQDCIICCLVEEDQEAWGNGQLQTSFNRAATCGDMLSAFHARTCELSKPANYFNEHPITFEMLLPCRMQ